MKIINHPNYYVPNNLSNIRTVLDLTAMYFSNSNSDMIY